MKQNFKAYYRKLDKNKKDFNIFRYFQTKRIKSSLY